MRVKNRELYSVRPQNFKHGRPDYGHLALAYYIALCQGDDTVFRLDCYTTSISAPDRTITNACFLKFRPVSLYDLKKYTKYEASVHYSPFSYL